MKQLNFDNIETFKVKTKKNIGLLKFRHLESNFYSFETILFLV